MEGCVNLLYSVLMSGGKSFVVDLLLMCWFCEWSGSVAMFVLSFVVFCEERADSLENFFVGMEFWLWRMYGGWGGVFLSDLKMNILLVFMLEWVN